MIQSIFLQIVGFLLITFFGYLIMNLLVPEISIMEKTSLGFLIGLGIFTFTLFLAGWFFYIPFKIYPVMAILLWLILTASYLNVILKKIRNIKHDLRIIINPREFLPSFSWFEKVIVWILVFIFGSVLISDLYWPIWIWDAIALYDYRAKQMVLFGKIVGAFTVNPGSYPLLTSMVHGVIYLFGGNNPQYIYFLFFLALSLITYSFLRRLLKKSYALTSLLFIVIIPLFINQAQVTLPDLPQSAYLAPGFLYMILGLISDKKSYIVLSSVLFGLSGWVRLEPFWIVGFFILFVFSLKRMWIILDGVFLLISYFFNHTWNLFTKLFASNVAALSTHSSASTNFYANYLNPDFWSTLIGFVFKNIILPVWPLFLALIFLAILRRRNMAYVAKLTSFSTLSVFIFFVMGISVYIITFPDWQGLYSSLQRILIFLDILAGVSTSLLLFPLRTYKQKNSI